MHISTAQFLQLLRRRLGNPSVKELGDEFLTDAVAYTLRDYSKVKPRNRQMLLVQLFSGQETYVLDPAPAVVLDVIPSGPLNISGRIMGNEFRAVNVDVLTFNMPDFQTYYARVSQYREMFEVVEWNYDEPPLLYILNPPAYNMSVLVVAGDVQTVASAPDHDEEILLLGAMSFAQEMWANQRDSLTVMEAPTAQGTVNLQSGDRLRTQAAKNRKDFENRLGWNRPFIGQG